MRTGSIRRIGRGNKLKFGILLKIKRIESGLRQLDIAKKTGIPEWKITKLETSRAVPKPEELEKLRAVFGDF